MRGQHDAFGHREPVRTHDAKAIGLVAASSETLDIVKRYDRRRQGASAATNGEATCKVVRHGRALQPAARRADDEIDVGSSAEQTASRGQDNHADHPDQKAVTERGDESTVEIDADQSGKYDRQNEGQIMIGGIGDPEKGLMALDRNNIYCGNTYRHQWQESETEHISQWR